MENYKKLQQYRQLRKQYNSRTLIPERSKAENLRASMHVMDMTENYLQFMALNELREGEIGVKNAYIERVVESRKLFAVNTKMFALQKMFNNPPLFLRQASS